MDSSTVENLQKRLLSNSAQLLMLRRAPDLPKTPEDAELLITNLAKINQQADSAGDTLLAVSALLIQEVVDDIYRSENDDKAKLIDKAIIWHEQARRYVKQPNDEKTVSTLICSFPEEYQTDLKHYVKNCHKLNDQISECEHSILTEENPNLIDAQENLFEEPYDENNDEIDTDIEEVEYDILSNTHNPLWDNDIEFDEFLNDDVDSDSPSTIMHFFGQEFLSLSSKIEDLYMILDNENLQFDTDELFSQIQNSIDVILEASTEASLDGLACICDFSSRNLKSLGSCKDELKKDCIDVFQILPKLVSEYLFEPEVDQRCLDLVECLTHSEWLTPLSYRDEKKLLYSLVKQSEIDMNKDAAHVLQVSYEHVSLNMSEDATPSFIDSFFMESDRQAEELAHAVANISKGVNISESVRIAQRLCHTLKGSANLLGVQGIANIAHYLEDIFEYLSSSEQRPSKQLSISMQESADTIEIMIECLASSLPAPDNSEEVLRALVNWVKKIEVGSADLVSPSEVLSESPVIVDLPQYYRKPAEDIASRQGCLDPTSAEIGQSVHKHEVRTAEDVPAAVEFATTEMLRVPKRLIDNILNMMGETSISLGQMQERLMTLSVQGHNIKTQDRSLQSKRFELEELINVKGIKSQKSNIHFVGDIHKPNFDSLEMDEYNEFYGAAHSYIEAVSDTRVVSRKISQELEELQTLFSQQQRLNKVLQDMVMSTRMVAVSTLSARLQRTVRQAARMTEKDVNLLVKGEQLQVDGDLLNKLADPIMHLLRNAVDHGIEPREIRFDKGKPEVGNIEIGFAQEGNHLVVRCEDDGAGLSIESILDKAIAKGMVNTGSMSKEEIARLILAPGFSTRESATQISGRGVGMDVVNSTVASMKGHLNILFPSDQSRGAIIELRLPVTLLTNHSMLVSAGGQSFAIPTHMLEQILTPGAGQFDIIGGQLNYSLDRDIYPALCLNDLLGVSGLDSKNEDEIYTQNPVLLVQVDNQIRAVVIDGVSSSVELVVKELGDFVGEVPGVSGVSLLGSGEIVPVIDLPQLVRARIASAGDSLVLCKPSLTKVNDTHHDQTVSLKKILIVDDSLSARGNLAELAKDAGYKAILARDGIEALNLIDIDTPDIVLTDLEMPRMNGLELTAKIRSDSKSSHLPVVMITSRGMKKHRDEAESVGVTAYVTKPYVPEELMCIVRDNCIGSSI